jgi:hypothetical protein
MASGRLVFSNWMPALDADGVPIPNAQMFFYVNRTTTLATVYADEALTTPLANPVLADSSGQFVPVWADDSMLFSAAVASITLGQFDTIDDLAPSSSVGGAANKLDRDGGNPEPEFLNNVGAAAVDLQNATVPLFDTYQPPAPVYHKKRTLLISDMQDYEDDPTAPNDIAWANVLSDATDQYASGEIGVVDTFRLAGATVGMQKVGFTVPQDVKIVSGDNMDLSLNASRLWSGKRAALVFANDVTQWVVASEGSKLVGLNLLQSSVTTPPSSVSDFFSRIALYKGDAITANSIPGFEAHDISIAGAARTGVILGCERFNMNRIKADTWSGLEVLTILDVSYLTQISQQATYARGWWLDYLGAPGSPNYAARRRLYDWSLCRPGTGLRVAPVGGIGTGTGADGLILRGFQPFGMNVKGLHAIDANACFFHDMWPDHVFGAQATAAQASAYAALSAGAQTTVKTNTMAAALTDASGGTSGFNYAQYNAHPVYGIIQSIGVATEGDCQNTRISGSHVDGQAKSYAFLHGGGQIGIIASDLTSGTARLSQFEFGDNRGRAYNLQCAGGADDAAILVGPGVQDWVVTMNGDESTAAQAIRYGNSATAKNFRVLDQWYHNGVLQQTNIEAYPGNVSPTTGSFQPVIRTTEVRDGLGEYNNATGVYTAKYPGVLTIESQMVFAPNVATLGVHILRINQNGNPVKDWAVTTSSTRQADAGGTLSIMVNPGDTITESVFHEVSATWTGAQSLLKMRREAP